MATAVKSASEVSAKWARVTPQRTEDYTSGVQNPTKDWKQSTIAADARYKEGVQKAISRGAFAKGINASSTETWKKGAVEKGSSRWSEGIAVSQDKYSTNIAPYLDVIRNTALPERYPKGDPRNIERVKVLNAALRKKKEGA
ncbi:MAG: hypothetical protein M0R06_10565 [Sphaerochaeta sp.]|jgi:hypothetical protein|nr:hypothetical protein [Sphaerochaeta sp.]